MVERRGYKKKTKYLNIVSGYQTETYWITNQTKLDECHLFKLKYVPSTVNFETAKNTFRIIDQIKHKCWLIATDYLSKAQM